MGRLHSGRAGRTWWGLRPDPVVGRDATGTGERIRQVEGETLAGIVSEYEGIAARTDELVASLDSLDISHPLPSAPWFEAGARWSARRALLHIIAETAQHAGHADMLREAIDGSKTMG